jgi:hypothetical protein
MILHLFAPVAQQRQNKAFAVVTISIFFRLGNCLKG